MYEETPDCIIPPLLYAQDTSTNGTYLLRSSAGLQGTASNREIRMTKEMGALLLFEGDRLRIGRNLLLVYHDTIKHPNSSGTLELDDEVGLKVNSHYHTMLSALVLTDLAN
jgi:hypothetical protein